MEKLDEQTNRQYLLHLRGYLFPKLGSIYQLLHGDCFAYNEPFFEELFFNLSVVEQNLHSL